MALFVYNRQGTNITLAGLNVVVPASPAPPSRGPGVNVTSELDGLTPTQFAALETQRVAQNLSYEWTGSPEFATGTLETLAPLLEPVIAGDTYDYIIVGAGTAGAPLAKWLSEDGTKSVLVLEAGSNFNSDPRVLDATDAVLTVEHTEASPVYTNASHEWQPFSYLEGRGWGGGSLHNFMQAVRLTPEVMTEWATVDSQWSYANLLPLMKYMETFVPGAGMPNNAAERGTSGPLTITGSTALNPANPFYTALTAATNSTVVQDHNDKTQPDVGVSPMQVFASGGLTVREFSGTAFLGPTVVDPNTGLGVSGRKLTIVSKAVVDKVLLEFTNTGPEAKGVRYHTMKDGRSVVVDVFASTKVILCAGAFSDPAILQRSGIGDATLLGDLDIPIFKANSNVGEHMHSHNGPYAFLDAGWDFGAMPDNPEGVAAGFFDLSGPNGLGAPDGVRRVQTLWALSPFFFVMPLADQSAYGITPFAQFGVAMLSFHLEPSKDGFVRIVSQNPTYKPLIDFKVYEGPGGADMLAQHVKTLKMAANVGLQFNDSFPLYPPAKDYPSTWVTTGGMHDTADESNNLASLTAPTNTAESITVLNDIKAKFNAHRTQAGTHLLDDTYNAVAAANATDEPTAITLANEIKVRLNAHLANTSFHNAADKYNAIQSGDASDEASLVDLTTEMQAKYETHLSQPRQQGEQSDDSALEADCATNYIMTFHACGTCRMSVDDTTGVVDGNLDVHGVSKLSVCSNASVKVSQKGNTSYVAYVMGLQKAKIEGAATPF